MAKLRHIALIVEDPEASARFFAAAFGMTRTGEFRCGCYMSDGTVTVALLKKETPEERIGIDHFGLLVDDLDDASRQVIDAGAVSMGSHPPGAEACYEAKFLSPDGIVFDLSHTGWPGAANAATDDACLTNDHPVTIKMYEVINSKEGREAAIAATKVGLPAMAGIDPLLQVALGSDYGPHNMGTATAGALVGDLMLSLGYQHGGKRTLPQHCVAKTAEFWV